MFSCNHLAKDACVALGVSKECYLDADAVKDDEQEEKAADKKPDAVAYFGDDGSVSSPASGSATEHLPTFGQGIHILIDWSSKVMDESKTMLHLLVFSLVQLDFHISVDFCFTR